MLKWIKQQSGSARSVSCETHGAHLSYKADDDYHITIYRRKPKYEPLGHVASFKEAIDICERDYEEGSK